MGMLNFVHLDGAMESNTKYSPHIFNVELPCTDRFTRT
jgi:hypothetical protein